MALFFFYCFSLSFLAQISVQLQPPQIFSLLPVLMIFFSFKERQTHTMMSPEPDYFFHLLITPDNLFVNIKAKAIFAISGMIKGKTHQPSTVKIPTGPEEAAYTAINQRVPTA